MYAPEMQMEKNVCRRRPARMTNRQLRHTTSVINMTASGFWLCDITIGISYDDDIDKARRIMLSEAERDPRVMKDKEMMVLLAELADSSVKMELRCWTSIDDHWQTLWDLIETDHPDSKYKFFAVDVDMP